MMLAVNWFMIRALKTRYIPMSAGHGCMGRCCRKYGPCILTAVAAPLILADLCRHVAGDLNIWPWCGDPSVQRGLFPRVNESWTDACFWSSTEYVCNIPCCVPGNNTVASTNDLSMNYLLQYDNTSQRNYQRSFSQFCGLSADGEMMPIHGAPYTNPNCTCGGDACDQNKSPADQMALLDATDPALGALRVLAEGDKQDGNFPQGFGPDPTEPWDAAFGPWWPEYPQLDEVQLKRIKDQALLGGLDAESTPDCNCDNCVPPEQENIHHLSFIGVLFTIFFTYTGFVLLATGTLWNADILHKLAEMKKKWRLLRARRAKQRNKSGAVQQGSDDDRSTPLLGGSSKDGDQI